MQNCGVNLAEKLRIGFFLQLTYSVETLFAKLATGH